MLSCVQCGSKILYKDGLRYLSSGRSVQRWLCRNCGYRFSESIIQVNIPRQLSVTSNAMEKLTEPMIRDGDFTFKESFDKLAFPGRENVASHSKSTIIPTVGKDLYGFSSNSRNCRVCATLAEDAKNLAETETVKDGLSAAATKTSTDIKGFLITFVAKSELAA